MSEIDYDKLADAVAKRLSLLPPPEKIIWDAKRCAEYLGVTEKHFVDKLSKCFGFPTAIQLPSSTGRLSSTSILAAQERTSALVGKVLDLRLPATQTSTFHLSPTLRYVATAKPLDVNLS